jgi:uncharacterized protein (DUF924 family)
MSRIDDILLFWLGDLSENPFPTNKFGLWFANDPELDARIRDTFGDDIEAAARGDYDDWKGTPRGRLALLILLDQFTRNVFRGTADAFKYDPIALEIALEGIEAGDDQALLRIERLFVYLPLEHAEDRELQARSVALFEALAAEAPESEQGAYKEFLRHAVLHREIIDAYGRFPHRNEILGRASTPEEIAYLEDPDRPY